MGRRRRWMDEIMRRHDRWQEIEAVNEHINEDIPGISEIYRWQNQLTTSNLTHQDLIDAIRYLNSLPQAFILNPRDMIQEHDMPIPKSWIDQQEKDPRKRRRVLFSPEFFLSLLVEGTEFPKGWAKVLRGIPNGAEFEYGGFDEDSHSFYMVVYHDSFPPDPRASSYGTMPEIEIAIASKH
jgi:hypothetical protein